MLFSSGPQSYPTWGSFLMSKLFTTGGQSIGASALASVPYEYSGLISFRHDWSNLAAAAAVSLKGLANIWLPNIFFFFFFHLHVNCLLFLWSTKQLLPTSFFFKMVFKVRVLFISVSYSVFIVLYHVASHSSILAWRIPEKEEPSELQSMGSQGVRHDWTTNTHTVYTYC